MPDPEMEDEEAEVHALLSISAKPRVMNPQQCNVLPEIDLKRAMKAVLHYLIQDCLRAGALRFGVC